MKLLDFTINQSMQGLRTMRSYLLNRNGTERKKYHLTLIDDNGIHDTIIEMITGDRFCHIVSPNTAQMNIVSNGL